ILLIIGAAIVFATVGGAFFVTTKGLSMLFDATRVSRLPRTITQPLHEARYNGRRIIQAVQQCSPGPMKDRLKLTTQPVNEWLTNLSKLEEGLLRIYGKHNLGREKRRLTTEIESIRRRILTAGTREAASLRALLASKKQHEAALDELEAFQIQAELKIGRIASDLAATHAEILLITAKGNFNENRFQRLDESLQEQVSSIRDMLGAMEEFGYSNSAS
ncbi:MAG: hypothetical protein AAF629_37265, partial [Chloroflexota bacterium]